MGLSERIEKFSEPIPETGCFLWTGTYRGKGYGEIKVRGEKKYAHRVAWELESGPIPEDMHVLHHCDTPRCVNPDHLFLGTNYDNVQDMVKKGRHRSGGNKNFKITPKQVLEIRRSKLKNKEISRKYGIGKRYVRAVRNGYARTGAL